MQKLILLLLSVFAISFCNAQEPKNISFDASTKTFTSVKATKASNDVPTEYKWQDSKGVEYTIYLHKYTRGENIGKWTCFVFRTSKNTGKEYKYYIPNGMDIAEQIKDEYIKE